MAELKSPLWTVARVCLVVLVLLVLATVALWQGAKLQSKASKRELDASCETHGKAFNHGPVLAQGYRRAGEPWNGMSPSLDQVLELLTERRFRFVEVDVKSHIRYDMADSLPAGTTAVRYRLGVRGEPSCAYYERRFANYWPLRRGARESGLPDSMCIAVEPAHTAVATYVIEASSPRLEPNKRYEWHQLSLRDIAKGTEVARYRSFSLGNSRYTTYRCGKGLDYWRLMKDSILPSEEGDALDRMGIPPKSPVRDFYRSGPKRVIDRVAQPIPAPLRVEWRKLDVGWLDPVKQDVLDARPDWEPDLAYRQGCPRKGCVRLNLPSGSVFAPLPDADLISFAKIMDGELLLLGRARGVLSINRYALDGTLLERIETPEIVACDRKDSQQAISAVEKRPDGYALTFRSGSRHEPAVTCSYLVPNTSAANATP